MKKIVLTLLLLVPLVSFSQNIDSALTKVNLEELIRVELPPLEFFIEKLRENPMVKHFTELERLDAYDAKSKRQSWLNYIRLNGYYEYGYLNTSVYSGGEPGVVLPPIASGNAKSMYGVGASVGLPLSELIGRKNRNMAANARREASAHRVDMALQELTLTLVTYYHDAKRNLAMLKIKGDALGLALSQYQLMENDFINKKISIQELTRQKNLESIALTDFEFAKMEFTQAVIRLEVMINHKIMNPDELNTKIIEYGRK